MRVLKWNVPVDDKPHEIGSGSVVLVACQNGPEAVQVWTEEETKYRLRKARVYGTGMVVRDGATHLGSTMALDGALVWHVYEVEKAGNAGA